jgi:hypothetical protein
MSPSTSGGVPLGASRPNQLRSRKALRSRARPRAPSARQAGRAGVLCLPARRSAPCRSCDRARRRGRTPSGCGRRRCRPSRRRWSSQRAADGAAYPPGSTCVTRGIISAVGLRGGQRDWSPPLGSSARQSCHRRRSGTSQRTVDYRKARQRAAAGATALPFRPAVSEQPSPLAAICAGQRE